MNKLKQIAKTAWKPAAGVAVLALIVLWTSGSCTDRVQPGEVEHRPGLPLPDGAETLQVGYASIRPRIDVVGTVSSAETIHLSSRISGYVEEIFASAGDRVATGQVLMTLDDREVREQLNDAEVRLRQAETEYHRAKGLFEAQAATEQALTAAESMLQSARARVDQVKVMLSYARITSPIDGIVTDRAVEVGDLANPGQVLLSVYDPARMRLEAPVPVRLLPRIEQSASMTVELEGVPDAVEGSVSEIVSEIDPRSRTRLVKIALGAIDADVLPGTFGRLWVHAAERDACLVPASAVYNVGQLELVQAVEDGRVLRRAVRTGPVHGEEIEVLSGLAEGDVILVTPIMEGT